MCDSRDAAVPGLPYVKMAGESTGATDEGVIAML